MGGAASRGLTELGTKAAGKMAVGMAWAYTSVGIACMCTTENGATTRGTGKDVSSFLTGECSRASLRKISPGRGRCICQVSEHGTHQGSHGITPTRHRSCGLPCS